MEATTHDARLFHANDLLPAHTVCAAGLPPHNTVLTLDGSHTGGTRPLHYCTV